jgi:hypothetical protein
VGVPPLAPPEGTAIFGDEAVGGAALVAEALSSREPLEPGLLEVLVRVFSVGTEDAGVPAAPTSDDFAELRDDFARLEREDFEPDTFEVLIDSSGAELPSGAFSDLRRLEEWDELPPFEFAEISASLAEDLPVEVFLDFAAEVLSLEAVEEALVPADFFFDFDTFVVVDPFVSVCCAWLAVREVHDKRIERQTPASRIHCARFIFTPSRTPRTGENFERPRRTTFLQMGSVPFRLLPASWA